MTATQTQFGPFADTEVSIYCDESRHEGQRLQRYMVIGGLWLPREKRGEILAGLRDIQTRHRITSELKWLEKRTIIIANSEGGFQKIFGETKGWASYSHQKTGNLDVERLRRARWIRPVLELRIPKTKIYVNNHSMKPRERGHQTRQDKKRIFVTTGTDVLYFISLVYLEHGLALSTAFEPDGQWLRETLKKHGTTMLSPML